MNRLLSVLSFACVLQAEFVPQAWRFQRDVKVTPAPYNVVTLDAGVYQSSSARLNDLRLLRSGKEIPYLIRALSSTKNEKMFVPAVSNRVAIPGIGVQGTLDVGRHSPHNRVTIETGELNFREQVRVETSEDGRVWGIVRRDGTIFDISTADQHASNFSVSYPESTRRFLRITIAGWTNPAALRSAAVGFIRESAAERDVVFEFRPNVSVDKQTRESIMDCDLRFDRPFDRIKFETSTALFSRPVTISVSRDKKVWSTAGFGRLERTARDTRLSVELPEQWKRYVRLVITNDDNPPLAFTKVQFEAVRREMVFPADQTGAYKLYSGNVAANPVRYDLIAILPAQIPAVAATLGPSEANPDYRLPSRPMTERSPWLLTVVLLILVPVIGVIAIRMLRQVKIDG